MSRPSRTLLAVCFLVYVAGVGWGLPASDGWDVDGIAPRDFLVGVLETYTPGKYFTYPPLHLLLLSILTAPVTLVAALKAPSFAASDLVATFIQVPYMTAFALVARVVAACMGTAILWILGSLAEELEGPRARFPVVAVSALSVPLTYYSQTSNLDVPYLFWACLSLRELARVMTRREARRLRWSFLFAAFAVCTKDQAYGVFGLTVPVALVAWLADPWPRAHRREVMRELGVAVLLAAGIFLLVDGALTNPTGFRARLAFLRGPASQDHVLYDPSLAGRVRVVKECLTSFPRFFPWPVALLASFGVVASLTRRSALRPWAARAVPLLAAVSFTVLFNAVARRTEERFTLPFMTFAGFYGGLGLHEIWQMARLSRWGPWARRLVLVAAAPIFAYGAYLVMAVDAAKALDPRYDAEAWLKAHAAPGDRVEVYGYNAYIPRLPDTTKNTRVDLRPVGTRSPLPGVEEIEQHYARVDERKPRFIVVGDGWVWIYRFDPAAIGRVGRVVNAEQERHGADGAARAYFAALYGGAGPYKPVHVSTWTSKLWPRLDLHASVTRDVTIFERSP